jgi:hypothetical protein
MATDDQTTIKPLSSRKHTGGARKGNKHALTHGLTVLKHAVNGLGNRLVDKRTVTGKALAKWRAELIQDLGGDVSTQQFAIIDLAVKSKLLLDSIDAWLLVQPSLINARKRALLPAVRERQTLADGLAKYMSMLGLHRRIKTPSLSDLLSQEDEREPDQGDAKH